MIQQFHPIFLTLHYKGTENLIKAHVTQYNQQLAQEWTENSAAFEKKYGETYKKRMVKPCHINTFLDIRDMFAAYLNKNRRFKLIGGRDATFRLNNVWVSKKTGLSETTAWRHIKKGLDAGVFQKKVWHGTNSTYELEFNPELLEAEYDPEYCELLVQNTEKLLISESITPELHSKLMCSKPRFLDFPSGRMLSGCNHICIQLLLQEHNGKMISGVGGEKTADDLSRLRPEHGSMDSPENSAPESVPRPLRHDLVAGGSPASTEPRESLTRDQIDLIQHFIRLAWTFAYTAIFNNKYISEADERNIKNHLLKFFTPAKASTSLAARYENFCERILLAKKYQMRNPDYTFMNPVTYFDPDTIRGFKGTKEWHYKQLKKREVNKEWNENNRELTVYFRKFCDYPSSELYHQITQKLSKKKSTFWLDMFNELVINMEKLTPELFQKYFEKTMESHPDANRQ